MPMHDWTRIEAGPFHSFHNSWIAFLTEALNTGLLPAGYIARSEQRAGLVKPDVLAFETNAVPDEEDFTDEAEGWPPALRAGRVALLTQAPPRMRLEAELELDIVTYAALRRTIAVRRGRGERLVAIVEIVSRANKDRPNTVAKFVEKAVEAIEEGIHLVVVDILPPGRHDPRGMHGAIWDDLGGKPAYAAPSGQPLTLAAYCSGDPLRAYVEPFAVGDALVETPLFLDSERYVSLPLEETYARAFRALPFTDRRLLRG